MRQNIVVSEEEKKLFVIIQYRNPCVKSLIHFLKCQKGEVFAKLFWAERKNLMNSTILGLAPTRCNI